MTTAIDLFAGWGGFTAGAERANVHVAWAANHWKLAVDAHAANHPNTAHVCQDLRQADWGKLPNFDLLLAAPACQGHSQAAQPARAAKPGTRAKHDALRATAWAVVDCAEVTAPAALCVENVPDFLRWKLYPVWRLALESLGYTVHELKLCASLYGAPQRRDRVFIVGTRAKTQLSDVAPMPNAIELAFGPCIDWAVDARWTRVVDGTPRVRERIAKGRQNHGGRFLTQHVTGHPGVGLDEPIRTVTTKDQWAVVDGDRYRPLTVRETARAMGFADDYAWPEHSTRRDAIKGLGNAVCPPVATELVRKICTTL